MRYQHHHHQIHRNNCPYLLAKVHHNRQTNRSQHNAHSIPTAFQINLSCLSHPNIHPKTNTTYNSNDNNHHYQPIQDICQRLILNSFCYLCSPPCATYQPQHKPSNHIPYSHKESTYILHKHFRLNRSKTCHQQRVSHKSNQHCIIQSLVTLPTLFI